MMSMHIGGLDGKVVWDKIEDLELGGGGRIGGMKSL